MDKVLGKIDGVGEYGIDTQASPGNGRYYVKLEDGSYDVSGFNSKKEAKLELEVWAGVFKRQAERREARKAK